MSDTYSSEPCSCNMQSQTSYGEHREPTATKPKNTTYSHKAQTVVQGQKLANLAKGYLLIAFSAFVFACCGLLAQFFMVKWNTSVWELVFLRSSLHTVISFILIWRTGLPICLKGRSLAQCIAVGLCFSCTMACFYYGISKLPFGDGTAISFTSPVFAVVLGRIFIGEPMGLVESVSCLVCLTGLILETKPAFIFGGSIYTPEQNVAALIDLISALSEASMYLVIRGVGHSAGEQPPHALHLSCWSGLMSTIVSFSAMGIQLTITDTDEESNTELFQWVTDPIAWFAVACLGITAVVADYTIKKGVQQVPAAQASIVRASDIVWAFVGQITLIGDPSNWFAISGASLVFLSGIILAIPKLLEARHEARLEKEGYEHLVDSDGWTGSRFMNSPSSATYSEQPTSVCEDRYYQETSSFHDLP